MTNWASASVLTAAVSRGSVVSLLVVACAASTGCDSKATASDPQVAAPRPEQKSKEFESCGATMHCADDLRCFDQTCQRTTRSTVGDYFAAVGAQARAHGDFEAAIAAYASALGHYDAEKIPLPAEIDCAYGGALVAAKARKDHAELGARVLHRCVLAVPAASSLRVKALAELATLNDSGLDPLLLGAPKTADLYLTKGPAKPATDKLAVTVTAAPQPKNLQVIVDKLAEPDYRAALVACWDANHAQAKVDTLAVTIGLKSSYVASEYEDEPGVFTLKVEPAVAMPAGAAQAADACVRQVVEPALKTLKIAEAFASKLTITVK